MADDENVLESLLTLVAGTEETYQKVYDDLENCVLSPSVYDRDLGISFEEEPLCIVDTVCSDLREKYPDRIDKMYYAHARDMMSSHDEWSGVIYRIRSTASTDEE